MSVQTNITRTTVRDLISYKQCGHKIVCMTAYDSTMTVLLEVAGVDVILVGDSLGMVIQGQDSTLPVTIEDVIYHLQCVCRSSRSALLVGDMPFMSYSDLPSAIHNAGRLLQEGGAQMVKLEGGDRQLEIVPELVGRGIPVCAHLGLQPQSVHKMGGYRVQGRDTQSAQKMLDNAKSLDRMGIDMLLLECVPQDLAKRICEAVTVPVVGIGAGGSCDGQILVIYDALGLTAGHVPKFARDFSEKTHHPAQAIKAYVQAVRCGDFPAAEHCFS